MIAGHGCSLNIGTDHVDSKRGFCGNECCNTFQDTIVAVSSTVSDTFVSAAFSLVTMKVENCSSRKSSEPNASPANGFPGEMLFTKIKPRKVKFKDMPSERHLDVDNH